MLDSTTNQEAGASTAAVHSELFDTPSGPVELRVAATGHRYVWPRPTAEELAEIYGEDYYASDKPAYFEKTERELEYWDGVWDLRRQILEDALPVATRPRRILDVGCAGGFLLDTFRRGGWEVSGVEPSRRAVEYARERFGLDLFCGPLEEYQPEEKVDAIHASQVLEHVLDPVAFAERMSELLNPGGVVFIESPNEFNPLQTAVAECLDKSAWWIVPRHHLNYFDYDSLSGVLAQAGLVEVERLATFPVELLALMGKDYVGASEVGREVHQMRMDFEGHMLGSGHGEDLRTMYRQLAAAGMGRTACIVARKES